MQRGRSTRTASRLPLPRRLEAKPRKLHWNRNFLDRMCVKGVSALRAASLSCSKAKNAANLAHMRPVRLQLALAYCLWQLLACADADEPDDGISYHPRVGGPIVEFPGRRGGPISDESSERGSSGRDAGVAPHPIIGSPGGTASPGVGTMNGGAATGAVGGTGGGVAGGTEGSGGGTIGGLGGIAGGTAGGPLDAAPPCDAGAPAAPADAGAADAGAGGDAGLGCGQDTAAVDAATAAPDPAP